MAKFLEYSQGIPVFLHHVVDYSQVSTQSRRGPPNRHYHQLAPAFGVPPEAQAFGATGAAPPPSSRPPLGLRLACEVIRGFESPSVVIPSQRDRRPGHQRPSFIFDSTCSQEARPSVQGRRWRPQHWLFDTLRKLSIIILYLLSKILISWTAMLV